MTTPRMATLAAIALLSAGCNISLNMSDVTVDGVVLEETHIETLDQVEFAPNLVIESVRGDIELVFASDASTLEIELYEHTPGDAYAEFEAGVLVAKSRSGEPVGIGDVTIRTDRSFTSLLLATEMGDIDVTGISVSGNVRASTGLGDVDVTNASCAEIESSSGLGDIELESVTATRAVLSTGLGDVDVDASTVSVLEASTGLGDVDCTDSEIGQSDLSSGLGSTSER